MRRAAAVPLKKFIASTLANAENNFKLEKDNLFIKKIFVDMAPVLKRWLPRAQGRATPLRKGVSHVTIVLEEKAPTVKKTTGKEKKSKDAMETAVLEEVKPKEHEVKSKEIFKPEDGKKIKNAARGGRKLFARKSGM